MCVCTRCDNQLDELVDVAREAADDIVGAVDSDDRHVVCVRALCVCPFCHTSVVTTAVRGLRRCSAARPCSRSRT
jgi:hypothetical protein